MTYSGTAAAYASWSPPSWVRGQVASSISNLVYATPDEMTMRQVCASSKAAGYMYVTNDVLPNPWDTLPARTFWTNSVASCR